MEAHTFRYGKHAIRAWSEPLQEPTPFAPTLARNEGEGEMDKTRTAATAVVEG